MWFENVNIQFLCNTDYVDDMRRTDISSVLFITG